MTERHILRQVLDAPVESVDVPQAATVREYLKILLLTLWKEKQGFSGKRPYGNSGWDYDLHVALVRAHVVPGAFDEDGYLDEHYDLNLADKLIGEAIAYVFEEGSDG